MFCDKIVVETKDLGKGRQPEIRFLILFSDKSPTHSAE